MDFNFSVKFENNSAEALDALKRDTERALYAMGVKSVEGAVEAISGGYGLDPAVDTGRLRASISFITPEDKGDGGQSSANEQAGDKLEGSAEQNTTIVGSNVEYASYVHNGTSRMAGRPFLREGIDRNKKQMQEQIEKIFKGEL